VVRQAAYPREAAPLHPWWGAKPGRGPGQAGPDRRKDRSSRRAPTRPRLPRPELPTTKEHRSITTAAFAVALPWPHVLSGTITVSLPMLRSLSALSVRPSKSSSERSTTSFPTAVFLAALTFGNFCEAITGFVNTAVEHSVNRRNQSEARSSDEPRAGGPGAACLGLRLKRDGIALVDLGRNGRRPGPIFSAQTATLEST
jgi:hypothetical protein